MKLNTKRTFFIGLAFMAISSFWQLYDQVIPLMLDQTFQLSATVTGFIMSMDNILALFMLPLFGALSDKVNTKLGKRTPFIMLGTIGAVLFLILIPLANQMKSLVLFIFALTLTLIAMQSYRSPAVALMPDLTPKPLRSKANAIINLMGSVGGILSLLLIKLLVPEGANPNYFPLFVSLATIMLLALAVLMITVKEKQLREQIVIDDEPETVENGQALAKDVQRSLYFILASIAFWFMGYNAVTTAFSRYAAAVWGEGAGGSASLLLIATAVATISYIPIGQISSKVGRKKTILFGICLLAAGFGAGFFIKEMGIVAYIVFGLVGIAWASINVNSYPMVVEMSKGSDVGKYTGIYYTFSMSAQIITPIISGVLIDMIGWSSLFPYAFVCCVMALFTFKQVQHGDNRPLLKKGLEAFEGE